MDMLTKKQACKKTGGNFQSIEGQINVIGLARTRETQLLCTKKVKRPGQFQASLPSLVFIFDETTCNQSEVFNAGFGSLQYGVARHLAHFQ